MANQNIRIPRFYCDYINYRLSRGIAQDTRYDVKATGGSGATASRGLQSGTEAELFDMKPLNLCGFDTGGDTDSRVVVSLDVMGESSSKISFVAILNHNLATAQGKIRISASDTKSHIEAVNFGSATAITCSEVVNADTVHSNNVITPATDGSTIIKFAESDLRYWGIQFEGINGQTDAGDVDGTWGSTDLTVANILVGEIFEMPHAPDMSVKRSIMFDQVKIQESVGGQRYSNMTSHGRTASTTSKSPFTTTTVAQQVFGGRIAYDMSFSFLKSTDLMPDYYDTYNPTDDSTVEDIWNITNGPHLPFIFSIDKDSEGDNAESEHIFARFAQNNLDMSQVALDTFNISMRIEEEF